MGKLTMVNLSDRQKAEVVPYWQLREATCSMPTSSRNSWPTITSRAPNNCSRSRLEFRCEMAEPGHATRGCGADVHAAGAVGLIGAAVPVLTLVRSFVC